MSQILGALFAILVGIVSIPTYLQYQNQSSENLRAAATAQQQTQFNTASSTYIQQNATAIQAIATATTPAVVTVAMLQAVNLLPASFSTTNPYGQTWQLEVLQPTAGNLQALAMTTGGTVLPDKLVTKIATIVGANGGFIPKNDSSIYAGAPGNAYGAYAGWTVPTANYTGVSGGELASLLTFNNGQLTDNRLYRNAVPGQPQLNQMNTPLVMAATQILNSACPTNGAIAQDGNGGVISCQGGKWQAQGSAYWKDPVANAASLPACNAAAAWQTRVVDTPSVGTGPRAYTCDGAAWQALAVDDSGNLRVDGQISVGANNRILGNGAQGTYGATTIAGQKNGWTGVEYRDSAGNYQVNQMTNRSNIGYYDAATGRWLSYQDTNGNLTLDQTADMASGRINPGWAVETWGCPSNGMIAKAAYDTTNGWAYSGLTLSCQSGVWKKASGTPGNAGDACASSGGILKPIIIYCGWGKINMCNNGTTSVSAPGC